jgi:hypothetical protein
MDPCITNTNINNARSAVRSRLGVPKSYAKNFTRKQICNAMKRCKSPNSFPPAKIDTAGEYIYLIDPDSPLSAEDYTILFEGGKKPEIVSLAKKLGLVDVDKPISELKANIINLLEDLKLREPIKAMKIPQLIKNTNNRGNNLAMGLNNINNNNRMNNLAMGLPNNNRGNNLAMGIPNNNRGNTRNNSMNNNRLNTTAPGLSNKFKLNGGAPAPQASRQLPGGRVNTFNKQNESKPGFFPGRPKPSALIPGGVGGKTTPTTNVNSKALIKRLDAIKDQIGVFSSLNVSPPPKPSRGPTSTAFNSSATSRASSQPFVQHIHVAGPASSMGSNASSAMGSGI